MPLSAPGAWDFSLIRIPSRYLDAMRRSLLSGVLGFLMVMVGVAPSASADTQSARTWSGAAQLAGEDGSLWKPTYRAGLKRSGPISVTTDTFPGDGDPQLAMAVFASYGNDKRGFTITQKFNDYAWAAEPAFDRAIAPVGKADIMIDNGDPDTPITLKAEISANCYLPKDLVSPPPPPTSFTCSKTDVKRFGGVLEVTVKPPSTMTAPGTSTVIIESQGISYSTLLRIASGLQQVMG